MATEPNSTSQSAPPDHAFSRRYCCCCLPVTRSDAVPLSTWWRSISSRHDGKWWGRGVRALLRFREWSERVAGPRWKTFIRRLNRTRSGSVGRSNGPFNYDPLSYALNFDEGQNGQFDAEEYYDGSRDFSARYAAMPSAAKGGSSSEKD
uniref:Uncharacterized protein n=1 Tax=Kalanchoe fedtschenkoi TaxID=63787 RepID=A0A7N0VDX8_KALFE